MHIDWIKNTITLEMNIWVGGMKSGSKADESRRKGTLVLSQLQSIIFENQPFTNFEEKHGTWIDIGTDFSRDDYPTEFKRTEHSGWIYFFKKSSCLYFNATQAVFKWTDEA